MKMLHGGQKGSVSLFIVIFAALLIITIGTAFIIIMIQGQGQATADDLSRSALDSANAGVEDVKRAVAQYSSNNCASNPTTDPCPRLIQALYPSNAADGWSNCQTTATAQLVTLTNGEVQVGNDTTLNQAYTCVKVEMNTPDYVGTLTRGTSRFVPLKSVGGSFDTIAIEWFSQANLQAAGRDANGNNKSISFSQNPTNPPLLPELNDKDWPSTMPTLLRTQLLQYNNKGFHLDDFDRGNAQDKSTVDSSDAATLFLYPNKVGAISDGGGNGQASTPFALNDNSTSAQSGILPLQTVTCKSGFALNSTDTYDGYACKAVLKLPYPIGTNSLADRTAYLRLTALYNTNTDFRVTMLNSQDAGADVHFAAVQPLVDSTGRANDLFRRVKDRIEASGNGLPYPEAALSVGHDLCKAFSVTNDPGGYTPDNSCKP